MSEPINTNEQKWLQGNRAAWLAILNHALRELTWDTSEVETPAIGMARAVAHLEETRKALRIACDDHGDNDWDDSLCLADVVDKHLIRHLNSAGVRDV